MADKRYANRGQTLEHLIKFANERYARKGIAVITKQATEFIPLRDRSGKIANVKVEHKATVDFLGRYKHYPIAIEAKNTNEQSIRFDRIELHQADFMDSFTACPGTIGMVVVSFDYRNYFAIPWAFWKAAYDVRVRKGDTKTPVSVSAFGQTWDVPKKKSVRMDELDPSWSIPDHDYTFGINYLQNADRYIKTP